MPQRRERASKVVCNECHDKMFGEDLVINDNEVKKIKEKSEKWKESLAELKEIADKLGYDPETQTFKNELELENALNEDWDRENSKELPEHHPPF